MWHGILSVCSVQCNCSQSGLGSRSRTQNILFPSYCNSSPWKEDLIYYYLYNIYIRSSFLGVWEANMKCKTCNWKYIAHFRQLGGTSEGTCSPEKKDDISCLAIFEYSRWSGTKSLGWNSVRRFFSFLQHSAMQVMLPSVCDDPWIQTCLSKKKVIGRVDSTLIEDVSDVSNQWFDCIGI